VKCILANEKFCIGATFSSCRYSGEMREIGAYLDEVANMLWDNVSKILSLASSILILFKLNNRTQMYSEATLM
jgi:hypothetical protein